MILKAQEQRREITWEYENGATDSAERLPLVVASLAREGIDMVNDLYELAGDNHLMNDSGRELHDDEEGIGSRVPSNWKTKKMIYDLFAVSRKEGQGYYITFCLTIVLVMNYVHKILRFFLQSILFVMLIKLWRQQRKH